MKPKILLSVSSKKENYINAVTNSGGIAVAQYCPDAVIDDYDGLLLCGGNDIDPIFYNEEINGSVDIDAMRDKSEFALVKAFVEQSESWEWTEHNLHEKLEVFRGEFKEKGIKPKATMWAIRGAVTGRTRGADMTATLDIIGKENCLARAKKAIKG